MATMNAIATIPTGVVFPNLDERDAHIGKFANYTKEDRLTRWPASVGAATADGVLFASDQYGGDEVTSKGNIWATNRADGLYVYRYGGHSADSVQVQAPNGYSGGTRLSGGVWDTTSTGTHLPFVIGLSWRYYFTDAHNGTKCAYPFRVALLYTDVARNRTSLNLDVKAHANSLTLGTSHSGAPSSGGYFAYKLSTDNIATVCHSSNPLYFMGVAVQWRHNHGTGNQSLGGTCWNGVPIISAPNYNGNLVNSWETSEKMMMCIKDSQTNTSTLADSSSKMFPLQQLCSLV